MALIKLGALAQDVRGSIAGTTFSKSRAGATTRQKVSPVQPSTERQRTVRSNLTTISQAWRNLTDAAQGAWNTWAQNHPIPNVFGDPIKLAGNGAFLKVNADLASVVDAGGSEVTGSLVLPLDAPPADPIVTPAAALSLAANAATGAVTVTTEAQEASSGFYAVWITSGYSTGKQYVQNLLKLGGAVKATAATSTLVITPADFNRRLTFQAGQKVTANVARYAVSGKLIDITRLDCIAPA